MIKITKMPVMDSVRSSCGLLVLAVPVVVACAIVDVNESIISLVVVELLGSVVVGVSNVLIVLSAIPLVGLTITVGSGVDSKFSDIFISCSTQLLILKYLNYIKFRISELKYRFNALFNLVEILLKHEF